MASEAPAYRCSICGFDWPVADEYETCPSCLGETDRIGSGSPLPRDEAFSLKLFFDFERFYEEWDQTQPPERLETKNMKSYTSG